MMDQHSASPPNQKLKEKDLNSGKGLFRHHVRQIVKSSQILLYFRIPPLSHSISPSCTSSRPNSPQMFDKAFQLCLLDALIMYYDASCIRLDVSSPFHLPVMGQKSNNELAWPMQAPNSKLQTPKDRLPIFTVRSIQA